MGRKVTLNFVECDIRFWCYMSWSEYFANCAFTGVFTALLRVYRKWSEEKISSEQRFPGLKMLC